MFFLALDFTTSRATASAHSRNKGIPVTTTLWLTLNRTNDHALFWMPYVIKRMVVSGLGGTIAGPRGSGGRALGVG